MDNRDHYENAWIPDQFIAIIFVVMIFVTKHLISIATLSNILFVHIHFLCTSARFLITFSFFTFS